MGGQAGQGWRVLLVGVLLLGGGAWGQAPPKRGVKARRFVSEQALRNLDCVTRWEQLCAEDPARQHRLEVHRGTVRYLSGPGEVAEYAIVGRAGKALRLAEPGRSQAVASLQLQRGALVYTGPDPTPARCALPGCAEVPECVPPEEEVSERFVSAARFARRLRKLMPLVPGRRCPAERPERVPPRPGELCLNTRKPYSPREAPEGKAASVRLDTQALPEHLSSDELTLLRDEAGMLVEVVRHFYAARLAQRPEARGTLTVLMRFDEGARPPEVYVQQDGLRDSDVTRCLSAALRTEAVFGWRPTQASEVVLPFTFVPR